MSRVSRLPIEVLLSLSEGPDLLMRWAKACGGEWDKGDPFTNVYRALLSEFTVHPARMLEGVKRVKKCCWRNLAPVNKALLLRMEANANVGVGSLDSAVLGFSQAYRAFGDLGDRGEQARSTIGWVSALGLQGKTSEAARVARLGRRLLPKASSADRARLAANLGNAWLHGGQYGRADRCFHEASNEFHRLGLIADAGLCTLNRGMTAWMRADVQTAHRALKRAQRTLVNAGRTTHALYAETGLSVIELTTRGGAKPWLRMRALQKEFEGIGDRRAVAWSHLESAIVLSTLGADIAAAPEAEKAWAMFRKLGFRDEEARSATLRARILASLGSHQLAVSLLNQSKRHWLRVGAAWAADRVSFEHGRVILRAGNHVAAEKMLRPLAARLSLRSPHYDAPIAWSLLAEVCLVEGRYRRALALARKAHRRAGKPPASNERPGMSLLVAQALAGLRRNREAVQWARRATRELEQLLLRFGQRQMRLLIGESRDRLYRKAVEVALQCGGEKAAEIALDFASQSRSPVLLEDLGADPKGKRSALRSALARLRDEILGSEGDRTDARHQGLLVEVGRLSERLNPMSTSSLGVLRRAWERRRLDSWWGCLGRRQVVFFDRGETMWRAFLLCGDKSPIVVELPKLQRALEDEWPRFRLVVESAARVEEGARDAFLQLTLKQSEELLAQLGEAIWEGVPIDPTKPVVVVPAGELHSVPLEAVLGNRHEFRASAVTRLPHPALMTKEELHSRSREALLLHNNEPGPRLEVERIADLLSMCGWNVALGTTRKCLTGRRKRLGLLHVATHGTFHRESWLLSGVRLQDGWVGLDQLPRGPLKGALVHFSSCESGRTNLFPGSDLDGWVTAGIGAGAREQVLTLWKVDDRSALEFTAAFYESWTAGASSSESCTYARSRIASTHPHPFRWAPFLSVG